MNSSDALKWTVVVVIALFVLGIAKCQVEVKPESSPPAQAG